jgi:hypothetical protein
MFHYSQSGGTAGEADAAKCQGLWEMECDRLSNQGDCFPLYTPFWLRHGELDKAYWGNSPHHCISRGVGGASFSLAGTQLLYRNDEQFSQIPMLIYCETRPTGQILVVNQSSADPGIKGVIPIPMDFDHISICKVADTKSQIYRQIKRFIEKELTTPLAPLPLKRAEGEAIPQALDGVAQEDNAKWPRGITTIAVVGKPTLKAEQITSARLIFLAIHLILNRSLGNG